MKRNSPLAFFCLIQTGLIFTNLAWARPVPNPDTRADAVPSKDSLTLAFPGIKGAVDYDKFGRFEGIGTPQYRFTMTDRAGLALAVGEGIYPNTTVFKDPAYQKLLKDGKLAGNQWRFVDTPEAGQNFYKWATTAEDPGVKQFYSSMMLERAGLLAEAVKGYYAVAVHFPKSIGYTYFSTPWYMGPAALDRLEQILRRHPELKMRWIPGNIQIKGKFDTLANNDAFVVNPGRLVNDKKGQLEKPLDLSKIPVIKTMGGPKVQLKEYENHHWQLFVDSQPFTIKCVTYSVTPVGLSPDRGTWNVSRDWQLVDTNKNGLHDGFFESYVDLNGNGVRDANEPVVGDARLLKDMGANTLRLYHHLYDKELFRRLYKEYGFYVLLGDVLGGYAVDSGATWTDGTDYRNPAQQERMLEGVRKMVEEFKDEPYVLMWVLGNENVYGVGNNSGKAPDAFFALVDRAAELIHTLDPTRPVAIANGDVLNLAVLREKAPHIDVFGANVYRGEQGFGRSFFQDVREQLDKPVLVTEFGAPAYAEGYSQAEAETYQAMYLVNNWEDLEANRAGRGVGNALGGVLFEYIDEWWKANSDLPLKIQKERAEWYASRSAQYKSLQPTQHDELPQFGGPYLDGWSYEEWFGVVSQGNEKGSPFARELRPAYFRMKQLWNSK
jgi:hypothetical protein